MDMHHQLLEAVYTIRDSVGALPRDGRRCGTCLNWQPLKSYRYIGVCGRTKWLPLWVRSLYAEKRFVSGCMKWIPDLRKM